MFHVESASDMLTTSEELNISRDMLLIFQVATLSEIDG